MQRGHGGGDRERRWEKRARGAPSPPVVAAKAFKGNIGIYYTGLGAVTPLNTVTVKSRIDGQLLKVQYQEGQLVHQGDVLVEIDPRPYEVVLTQAQGQLAKDQATLDNARIDLTRYQKLLNKKPSRNKLRRRKRPLSSRMRAL